MKFIMMLTQSSYINKDRIILGEHGYYSITLGVLNIIRDFNENDDYIIIKDTESVQIRPKALYKHKNGYYYKDKERIFLKEDEILEANKYIENLKNIYGNKIYVK